MSGRWFHAGAMLGIGFAVGTAVAGEAGLEAVRGLGAVNGYALHCKDLDLVRRIKSGMIETVPKLDEIGRAFENATSDAYVEASARAAPCPDGLEGRVHEALDRLRKAFGNQQEH